MKNVYVLRKGDDWDSDFVMVCASLKIAAHQIARIAWEDEFLFIDEKEIIEEMKEREKAHAVYLLAKSFDNNDNFQIFVQKVPLEEK